MKTIPLLTLAAVSLALSSCCSMFGITNQNGHYVTETKQYKKCGYDVVYETVPGSAKSGMATVEKHVPRYKTVTKKRWVSGGPCVRFYCPRKDACGTTSDSTRLMATAQGSVGSPSIGLVPTMKKIAP